MMKTLLLCLLGIAFVSARPSRSRDDHDEIDCDFTSEGVSLAELAFLRGEVVALGGLIGQEIRATADDLGDVAADDDASPEDVKSVVDAFVAFVKNQVNEDDQMLEKAQCLVLRAVFEGIDGNAAVCGTFDTEEEYEDCLHQVVDDVKESQDKPERCGGRGSGPRDDAGGAGDAGDAGDAGAPDTRRRRVLAALQRVMRHRGGPRPPPTADELQEKFECVGEQMQAFVGKYESDDLADANKVVAFGMALEHLADEVHGLFPRRGGGHGGGHGGERGGERGGDGDGDGGEQPDGAQGGEQGQKRRKRVYNKKVLADLLSEIL